MRINGRGRRNRGKREEGEEGGGRGEEQENDDLHHTTVDVVVIRSAMHADEVAIVTASTIWHGSGKIHLIIDPRRQVAGGVNRCEAGWTVWKNKTARLKPCGTYI